MDECCLCNVEEVHFSPYLDDETLVSLGTLEVFEAHYSLNNLDDDMANTP